MKKFSKLFALLLAFVLVLGSMTTVFAGNAMEPALTIQNLKGTVTISNALAGATYKLYRVLDISGTTGTGEDLKSAFVTNATWNTAIRELSSTWFDFTGDDVGSLATPKADLSQIGTAQQFAADVVAKAGTTITPDATATVQTSGAYDFTNLPYGYYVMVSSRQNAEQKHTVFTLNKATLEITEKNVATPTIDKKVNGQEAVSADFNSILNYTITITAVAGTDTYTITDILPSTIGFQNDLTVEKVSGTATTTLNGTGANVDYTFAYTEASNSFELTLTDACRKGLKDGDKLVIAYTGKLNPNNETINPYRNTAKLQYDGTKVISDTATVYTGHISFYKVDGKSGTPLAGAKFVLKSKDSSKYAVLDSAGGNDYNFSDVVDSADAATVILTGNTTNAYTIRGLDAREYILVEVEAPANYIKGEDTTVTISEKRDNGGKLIGLEVPASVTIVNMPGSTLPETGGTGTTIFYIAGAVLVVAALALLLIKRRASSEN